MSTCLLIMHGKWPWKHINMSRTNTYFACLLDYIWEMAMKTKLASFMFPKLHNIKFYF